MMILLRKMTEPEFTRFVALSIPEYAREKMKGEDLPEEAANKLAQESFAELLPNGLHSENQFLFAIVKIHDPQSSIGSLWFARKHNGGKSYAFIYDLVLNVEARGKGFGKKAMELVEEEVKRIGLTSIGLHVFGHNVVARKLYESCDYRVSNQVMTKLLQTDP